MDDPASIEQLKAELTEANQRFETLRSSLRFQIGDAVVSSLTGPGGLRSGLGGFFRVLNRARIVNLSACVQRELFSGLPRNGLPPRDDRVTLPHLKRLLRVVQGKSGASSTDPKTLESAWASAAFQLAAEFHDAARGGFTVAGDPARLASPPRRVLYVTQHDPLSTTNGYAKRTAEITQRLAARGYAIACVVPPKGGGASESRRVREGAVPYLLAGSGILGESGLAAYLDALSHVVEQEARVHRADVVHAASNYLNGLAALLAARRLGLPCVYEVRGLWEETRSVIDRGFPRTLGYRLQSRLEAHCAEQADAVIVGASEMAGELARRGVSRPFTVAPSGAPTLDPLDPEARRRLREKYGLADRPLLGFVGSITAYEGLGILLSALRSASLKDVCCLVIGDGPHADAVRDRVARMRLSDRVVMTGRLGFAEAVAGLASTDLCVYPRTRSRVTELVEPLKPLEALAAGIPVVVSDVAPLKRLADECPAVTCVAAGDVGALADAIAAFFGKPAAERQAAGDAARAWVMANRHWENTIDAVEEAYSSLVAPKGSAE